MTYISTMPPDKDKKRCEVHLMPDKLKEFERLAKKQNRSVKNLMETILLEYLEMSKNKGKD